jgi:succinyl-diaminopimelate desuccinylase
MAADGVLPKKAHALVVGEPTGNLPVLGHKGALWIHGTAHGKAAHGSMPEHGINAIVMAAKAISKLEHYFEHAAAHPLLGKPTINVGMISGGSKINMVPDKCEFEADIRSVPGHGHSEILAGLRQAVSEHVELDDFINAEAVYTDPSDPWLNLALDAIAKVTGENSEAAYVSYFTDASALSRAMGEPPTLVLGPGEKNMAHQTDEWCSVENIEIVSRMYYQIALAS